MLYCVIAEAWPVKFPYIVALHGMIQLDPLLMGFVTLTNTRCCPYIILNVWVARYPYTKDINRQNTFLEDCSQCVYNL